MARIELKNSRIRLVDGYSNTAAINQASDAPAAGDTTLVVDTVVSAQDGSGSATQVIPELTRFTIDGVDETYSVTDSDANALLTIDLAGSTGGTFTVSVAGEASAAIAYDATQAQIQTAVDAITGVTAGDFVVTKTGDDITVKASASGNFANEAVTLAFDGTALTGGTSPTGTQTHAGAVTHTITFTPALSATAGLPADNDAITFTGRSLEIKVGDGSVEFTENREFIYDLDRGNLDTVREGDQQPMEVSIDFVWEYLTSMASESTPTISDVLHNRGNAANWMSSSSDECEPFAIDIEIEHETPCGAQTDEITILPDFRWESLPHNLNDAQVSMTGRCNATEALVSRAAA